MQQEDTPQSAPVKPAQQAEQDGLSGSTRTWAILSLAIGVGLASLDTAIANTALPGMALQLHATPAASVWIVNVYQLAMVATLLPLAALGEIIGYRRVCIAGLMLFTAASLACALAWSLPSLVVARLFQGLGASAIMGVNSALLRSIYPARMLGRGFGTNAMVVAAGFALGPSLASLILAFSSWPWLFAINVPVGLLGCLVAFKALPRIKLSAHRFDKLTAFYNAGAFGMFILALGDAAHLSDRLTLLSELGLAVTFLVLLLRRQAGHLAPMLPVDLFRRPLFALSALTAVLTFAAQALAFVSLPFYFESVLGRSPIETGFLMTPWPVLVGIMAPIAGRLCDRHSPGLLGGCGLLVLALGLGTLLLLSPHAGVLDIVWRMALCGLGFGFFQAPNLKAIMSSAPLSRSGGASGIVATARLTGQACGAALVALCLSLSGAHGASYGVGLGVLFALVGSAISFSRLFFPETTASLETA